MMRVTLVTDKRKTFGNRWTEDVIIDETQQNSAHASIPKRNTNSSANNLLFEMSLNQFVEVTNILQCFFELAEKNKCHFSNVSSNQQGGDATTRRDTIWPRFIKPKRVVTCGRKTLLAWVNKELLENYTDLSQLNDGVAFCRLINNIAPGIIPRHKIKFYVGITRWSDNYRLLQQAFSDLRIDRALPGKGKELNQKDILVFTSWLKAFFEVNSRLNFTNKTDPDVVGDGYSCKDSGCGSGSGSDSEDRLLNATSITEIAVNHDKETQKDNELKSNQKDLPLHFIDSDQLDTQCYATAPTQNNLPSALTEIPNETILYNTDSPVNLISPKRFTTCGRKTLLTWISSELSREIVDLIQLSDGAAYCLLTNLLSPDTIPLRRITFKVDPFTHQENYNLLQTSFRYHNVRKTIPVQKLIEQNTKEILLFTNWFKAFYELNMASISKQTL